jgi:hypothetical protein
MKVIGLQVKRNLNGLHNVTSVYFDLKVTTEILGFPAALNNMFDCNCHKQCKSSFSMCASAEEAPEN